MSYTTYLHENSKRHDVLAVRHVTTIAVAKIETGNEFGGRLVNNNRRSNGVFSFRQGDDKPVPLEVAQPSAYNILMIVNNIFRTNCMDADAIDAVATWGIIVEELKPYTEMASTLALRYQTGMTITEAGKILGISGPRVHQRCDMAMRKLRHPNRIARIRNSIMGWPNLYRDI